MNMPYIPQLELTRVIVKPPSRKPGVDYWIPFVICGVVGTILMVALLRVA